MKSNIIPALLLATLSAAAPLASAQNEIPASQGGVVVYGSDAYVLEDNSAVELEIPSFARYNFVVSGEDWLSPTVKDGKITIAVKENTTGSLRSALLSVRTAAGGSGLINVRQPGWDLSDAAQATINEGFVMPKWAKDAAAKSAGRANSSSESIEKTYDGNTSTLFHSAYSGFDPKDPDQWPVLEYYFNDKKATDLQTFTVEAVSLVPRNEGGQNGRFGVIDIQAGRNGADGIEWTSINPDLYDLKFSASTTTVKVPDAYQTDLVAMRVIVHTGDINHQSDLDFASLAEIKFHAPAKAIDGSELFSDAVFSALKPGTTQAQVDAIANPLLKGIAQMMLDGKYTSEGLVSTHEAIKNPSTLSDEWNAPGKLYDQYQGVTGVALTPGKYIIAVSGIPASKGSVELGLYYWFGHERYQVDDPTATDGKREVKWGGESRTYTLTNGINLIDIPVPNRPNKRVKGDDMCLAYVRNYDDEAVANGTGSDVTVHIMGGLVNGYISNAKSNAENSRILDNAVYGCMDCVGSRTHTIWETQALKTYAPGEWVKLLNIYDQIIIWEHRVLGIEKYKRVPSNRTMAYVNYTYYMFQGSLGPSYEYSTQSRTCSPSNLMFKDSDCIWGLSHEWGHQHQMAPYFRWTGMAEVTNNIHSAYNVVHMGYDVAAGGRYPHTKWQEYTDRNGAEQVGHIHKIFINDNYNREITKPDDKGETKTANTGDNIVMSCRSDAAKAAKNGNAFGWSAKLKAFAQEQPKYPSKRFASDAVYAEESQNVVNPATALNAIEAYSGNNGELILAPYVNLQYWFAEPNADRPDGDERPDLWPDFYEAQRQNDYPEGSTIEKNNGVDKYELLSSIFNGNKCTGSSVDKKQQFFDTYSSSCWTTEGYISPTQNHWWQQNSGPYILNAVRKLSRLTGYNLWPYFDRYGVFTVCALEQGDYGTQYYIMTQDMYDEFKADMDALVTDGTLRTIPEDMLQKMFYVKATNYDAPDIPNDRPILPTDN